MAIRPIPEERAYIVKYSPYQNVKPDVKYPPIFFITETSDDRVTPIWARKMAAKMESMGHDVLFYENTEGGHGPGADHKRKRPRCGRCPIVYLGQKLGLNVTARKLASASLDRRHLT